jgi:SPX domain protein involved in polyphosphate accumulation
MVETVNNLQHLDSNDDQALAEMVSEDILNIDKYVLINIEACRKLIKKFAKQTKLSCVW